MLDCWGWIALRQHHRALPEHYDKCEQSAALVQVLCQHERTQWTLAVPLLENAHSKYVVARIRCTRSFDVQLTQNAEFRSMTAVSVYCKNIETSNTSFNLTSTFDPQQGGGGCFGQRLYLRHHLHMDGALAPSSCVDWSILVTTCRSNFDTVERDPSPAPVGRYQSAQYWGSGMRLSVCSRNATVKQWAEEQARGVSQATRSYRSSSLAQDHHYRR